MKRLLVAALLLLCAAAAVAQEFEIFDPNDFVDPRERGAVFAPTGMRLLSPGAAFSVVRVYGGIVSNYQWRDTPSGADLSFAHVVWNRYRDNWQLNLKLTTYDVQAGAQLPWYRGTVQFGRYFAQSLREQSLQPLTDPPMQLRPASHRLPAIEHLAVQRVHEVVARGDGPVR